MKNFNWTNPDLAQFSTDVDVGYMIPEGSADKWMNDPNNADIIAEWKAGAKVINI